LHLNALIDIGNDWKTPVAPEILLRLLQCFSCLYTHPERHLCKLVVDSDDDRQIILRGWTEDADIRLSVQLYFDQWLVLNQVDLRQIPGDVDELAAQQVRATTRAEIMADLSSLMPNDIDLSQYSSTLLNVFDKFVRFAQARGAAGYPLHLSLNRCKITPGAEEIYPNLVTM
jgi:hypothetical protein